MIAAKKRVLQVSIGLLSLLLFSECEKVRLVGPSRCSGRVEIFHRDSWGTVCDDHWGLANADVVCRELNCGTVLEAKKSAFFGEGKDEIWLDDVQCSGSETSILKCTHRPIGENNCGHSEDAGVICSDNVRLLNGTHRCTGRVEIYHNGHWKKVCSSDWGKLEGEVTCQEMNCGTPVVNAERIYFGEGQGLVGIKTHCVGNESSLSHCSLQELKDNCVDATVSCANNKPIRLMNGTNRCAGRVELYHNGQWGTVCDDRWGLQEASVACREMNCGVALAVKYKAFFGRGQDQVWLDDVDCTGQEKSLSDCPHRGFGEHDCDHSEDAGVVCSESIRLTNGTNHCSGRLEVRHNDHWRKMCANNWGHKEASIVCKEINCGNPSKSPEILHFGENSGLQGLMGRCTGVNISSIAQCVLEETQGSCEGVSLSCEGSPSIRLANGTNRCSGRVEILHDGQWGTVCDDEWDIKDAQVVCRMMDCGTAQLAKSGAFFGQGQGSIWLDDVNCHGNESSLQHCQHMSFGENNCGHGEDASVVCSATIRLIDGMTQCSGRVEVHHEGRWGGAYNVNWGMNEATVVCREMNCGDAVKFSGAFGQGGVERGYKVSCTGRESSLTHCTLREYDRRSQGNVEEVYVECSGNVKLAAGPNRCAGRVEFFDKGQWGTVCGEFWDINDATVVCKQLNCGRAHRTNATNEYGHGSGNFWFEQIECSGSESTLAECPRRPVRDHTCTAETGVAVVICTESLGVRLANSNTECTGRVEVQNGQEWETVCDTDWTLSKAEVVCKLLECGRAVDIPGGAHYGQGSGGVVEATESCFANMTTVEQCAAKGFIKSSCGHEHDAGAVCAAQLRLAGGSSECSGRVEIFYKGQWGTVCDDEWSISNGDVVCGQLSCGHAVAAPGSAHFGRGTGPIWLDNVECTGQETVLTHCTHPKFGDNNCGHGEDAGVICLGALQKPQITVSPSPAVAWGDRVEITCTVVSEHLGGTFLLKKSQGSFKMEKYSENEAATFIFPKIDFDQKGSYFCEYQKKLPHQVINYPQGNLAELSVTVTLDQPKISLTSPHAMLIYTPETVTVKEGTSFSVTCSIHSRYGDGVFYLMNTNKNTSEVKSAFGHSIFYLAYFEFPSIEYKHQGVYNCLYAINISSTSFCSSPSRSLQVSVIAPTSSSVVSGVVSGLLVLLLLLAIGYLVWRRRWRHTGTMVQFSNRFRGATKPETEDRGNGALDGRDRDTQVSESAPRRIVEDKITGVDNGVERVPEDLAGRVCYELEPLVLS